MSAFAHAAEIEASLERAADRCEDLTPLVYPRLFARLPDAERLFARDTTGAIRGEMLSRALSAILDYVDERRYAPWMIGTEAVTHSYYDVPIEQFGVFFQVIAETLKDLLGSDWTPAFDAAWARLLHELELYIENGSAPVAQVAERLEAEA